MKETYTYPVVLDYSEDGFINIEYPSFREVLPNCVEEGGDYISLAQDTIAMTLQDRYENGVRFPEENAAVIVGENQRVVYINLWLPYFDSTIKTKCVKKTLTIPEWLNEKAVERNINFSRLLTDALKRELGFSRVPAKKHD